MPYSAEQAKLLAGYVLATYERERKTTQRVIAAIPAGQENYTPDEKSMTSLALAYHLASSEKFFLTGVLNGKFESGEGSLPDTIKTAADVLAWYDANLPDCIEAVKAMPAEDAAREVDFFGMMQAQAFNYLTLMLNHSCHHRGQLSAYLRPMGATVPSIYGPSADSE